MDEVSIEISNERFDLLPSGAVYWPSRRTVIVADLHWGKDETFRVSGIPIPAMQMTDELDRLATVLHSAEATRLMVLGDLFHSVRGLTHELVTKVAAWRERFDGEVLVTRGNHDRAWKKVSDTWKINWVDFLDEGGFRFAHESERGAEHFTWSGHLHPTFRMKHGFDSLRLPCFYFGKRGAVLPAFNQFTRGLEMKLNSNSRVFVTTGRKVIEIPFAAKNKESGIDTTSVPY